MSKKNIKVGQSQVAGGVKVQLPKDSPLIGILKTDQYDVVNLYTNKVDKTFVESDPDGNGEEDFPVDPPVEPPVDPVETPIVPSLEDIVLIGSTGKRYYSGQVVTDPEIYYDSNNNRFLKVTFEVKNSIGDIVKGVLII
jgi:hypothetical protein